MSTTEKTARKGSSLFGIVLALLFVALGLYLYIDVGARPDTNNPDLVKIAGVACVIFFSGLLLFGTIKKLRK